MAKATNSITQSLSIYMSFFNKIKNQSGKIIKILIVIMLSNIFLLYFLHSYLPRKFYISQHTSQQNGITEKKNRHLIEIARSLMLNANVPAHHWGDAVLINGFLIGYLLPLLKMKFLTPYNFSKRTTISCLFMWVWVYMFCS